jgi:hypothetical protein
MMECLARCPGNPLQYLALCLAAVMSLFVLAAILIVEFQDQG